MVWGFFFLSKIQSSGGWVLSIKKLNYQIGSVRVFGYHVYGHKTFVGSFCSGNHYLRITVRRFGIIPSAYLGIIVLRLGIVARGYYIITEYKTKIFSFRELLSLVCASPEIFWTHHLPLLTLYFSQTHKQYLGLLQHFHHHPLHIPKCKPNYDTMCLADKMSWKILVFSSVFL